MIRLKINPAKTTLPLSISRGTFEQRLQKARLLNLSFYDNLQYSFKDNEVAPKTFISVLRKAIGKNFGLEIYPPIPNEKSSMTYLLDEKGNVKGYALAFPHSNYDKKVHKNNAKIFLKETQNLLNDIFNPKILRRFVSILGKGYNLQEILKFYTNNLSNTTTLSKEVLEDFLKNKKNKEIIETLQFMRYKLSSEMNTQKATFQMDNRIQRHNNMKFERPAGFYDLDKYHYEEKLNLLNEKLSETLKAERKIR